MFALNVSPRYKLCKSELRVRSVDGAKNKKIPFRKSSVCLNTRPTAKKKDNHHPALVQKKEMLPTTNIDQSAHTS